MVVIRNVQLPLGLRGTLIVNQPQQLNINNSTDLVSLFCHIVAPAAAVDPVRESLVAIKHTSVVWVGLGWVTHIKRRQQIRGVALTAPRLVREETCTCRPGTETNRNLGARTKNQEMLKIPKVEQSNWTKDELLQ